MDLFFWGALLFGAIVFVAGIVKDHGGQATRREAALQKQLARYPASARAVIVRGRQPAAWKQALYVLVAIGLVVAVPQLKEHAVLASLCDRMGGSQTTRMLLWLVFPGIPLLLMLTLAPLVLQSLRVLRGGYAPPLDSTPLHDTIAVSGWRATLRGVAGLVVMPVLVGFTSYLAFDVHQTFEAGSAGQHAAARCPTGLGKDVPATDRLRPE